MVLSIFFILGLNREVLVMLVKQGVLVERKLESDEDTGIACS